MPEKIFDSLDQHKVMQGNSVKSRNCPATVKGAKAQNATGRNDREGGRVGCPESGDPDYLEIQTPSREEEATMKMNTS